MLYVVLDDIIGTCYATTTTNKGELRANTKMIRRRRKSMLMAAATTLVAAASTVLTNNAVAAEKDSDTSRQEQTIMKKAKNESLRRLLQVNGDYESSKINQQYLREGGQHSHDSNNRDLQRARRRRRNRNRWSTDDDWNTDDWNTNDDWNTYRWNTKAGKAPKSPKSSKSLPFCDELKWTRSFIDDDDWILNDDWNGGNNEPTISPSLSPTLSPNNNDPNEDPTQSPSKSPTISPTVSPTDSPTISPTVSPTDSPTISPTVSPTSSPTLSPVVTRSGSLAEVVNGAAGLIEATNKEDDIDSDDDDIFVWTRTGGAYERDERNHPTRLLQSISKESKDSKLLDDTNGRDETDRRRLSSTSASSRWNRESSRWDGTINRWWGGKASKAKASKWESCGDYNDGDDWLGGWEPSLSPTMAPTLQKTKRDNDRRRKRKKKKKKKKIRDGKDGELDLDILEDADHDAGVDRRDANDDEVFVWIMEEDENDEPTSRKLNQLEADERNRQLNFLSNFHYITSSVRGSSGSSNTVEWETSGDDRWYDDDYEWWNDDGWNESSFYEPICIQRRFRCRRKRNGRRGGSSSARRTRNRRNNNDERRIANRFEYRSTSRASERPAS